MSAFESSDLPVLLLAGNIEARGSIAYTLRLARHLKEHGVSATLVTPDASLVPEADHAALNLREYRRLDSPLIGSAVAWCLWRDLVHNPPALVHIQSRRALKFGNWLARRLNCPSILTLHVHPGPQEKLRIDRQCCRRVIAVSPSVRDDLVERRGFPETLVTTITSGVDVIDHPPGPIPIDPRHVPVVGTAGPLEAIKGVPFFLGAAKRVLASRPDLEFLVGGAGPEEANLRRVARELGIANKVTFVPYVLDFTDVLAAMDIFCLPSLQQGLGTIMLEAMALGRPVIASGVGGVYDIVRDGHTGLIVPPQSSQELAQKILDLLDNPARARAIGAAARELVAREFNSHRMIQQTADLYREICACQPKLSPLVPS